MCERLSRGLESVARAQIGVSLTMVTVRDDDLVVSAVAHSPSSTASATLLGISMRAGDHRSWYIVAGKNSSAGSLMFEVSNWSARLQSTSLTNRKIVPSETDSCCDSLGVYMFKRRLERCMQRNEANSRAYTHVRYPDMNTGTRTVLGFINTKERGKQERAHRSVEEVNHMPTMTLTVRATQLNWHSS